MLFCVKCGHQIEEEAKFCVVCGTAVGNNEMHPGNKRKQEYIGKIVKCPACGEPLPSFVANCPACGYEIRNSESPNSVRELSCKIETATSDAVAANLIRTFPIPNTKEDLLEFMILASTNIENSFQREVSEAWSVKFEQAYEKTKIIYGETQELLQCYNLFLHKKEINQQRAKQYAEEVSSQQRKEQANKNRAQGYLFFERNKQWIVIAAGIVLGVALLLGIIFIPHALHEHKLERLVEEVEQCIENGEFEAARRKANQIIDDSGWSIESRYKWDEIRMSLLDAIEREELQVGNKAYVGISNDEAKGKNYEDIVAFFKHQGFTNVRVEAIPDLITGWITSDGEVEKVTINGSTVYEGKTVVDVDAEIVVYYHTFD